MPTSYLVSGANRGIGLGIIKALLKQSDAIIFAGVRDPSKVPALDTLVAEANGKLTIVRLTAGDVKEAEAAAKVVQEKAGGSLDVLIANAGMLEGFGPIAKAIPAQFTEQFNVNAVGPLILYQVFRGLLQKSSQPKFIAVSTWLASNGTPVDFDASPYIVSKAALNSVITKIALEDKFLVAIAISPGFVQTDMGNHGAQAHGMDAASLTVEESVDGLLKVIAAATKETHNGIFWDYTGDKLDW